MVRNVYARIMDRLSIWGHSVQSDLRRRLAWILIYALVFSLIPWTPPVLTEMAEQAFEDAPESVQWAAPLALTITGWADTALSTLAPVPVYAGTNITLSLSKRDDGNSLGLSPGPGQDPVAPGETFVYYIEITNTGNQIATIVLSDVLPVELSCAGPPGAVPGQEGGGNTFWFGNCSGGQAVLFTGDGFVFPIGEGLPSGGHAVLYVLATVQDSLPNGYTFTNARSDYSAYATQEATVVYTGSNDVTTVVRAPGLAIGKTAWPDPVEAGGEVTFTLAVSNSGAYTLTAPFTLTIVDRFPQATNYVRSIAFPNTALVNTSADAITWTIPFTSGGNAALSPGETLTASLVVTVDVPFTHTYRITNAAYSVSVVPTDTVTPDSANGAPVDAEISSHPSLSIAKDDGPDPVYANQEWAYWITVTNAASAQGDAVGLVITDRVPVSTVLQSVFYEVAGTSVVSDGTAAGSVITWTLPAAYSLFWGESTHVSFTVHLAAASVVSPTVITNAVYGATASNALLSAAGVPITTTVWGVPHLEAVKSVVPSAIVAASGSADVITFTVAVTNLANATSNATGLVITDTVPNNTELLSMGFVTGAGTVDSPSSAAGSAITWTLTGALVPGDSVVVSFTVHVSTPVAGGTTINNRAFAFSSSGDYTETNQVAVTVYSSPTLEIAKSAAFGSVPAGAVISYTILYTNAGTGTASGTVLSDALPADYFDGGWAVPPPIGGNGAITHGATIAWNVGTLNGGGTTGTVLLYLTTTSPLDAPVAVTNRVTIAASGGFSATASASVNVDCSVSLTIAKAVDQGTAVPGDVRSYTIVATNTGNQNAAGPVVITDRLPSELTVTGVSPSAGSAVTSVIGGATAITWTLASVAGDGGSAQLTIGVQVTSPLTNGLVLANTAWLSHGASITASEQVTILVISAPDLVISKAGPSQARPGEAISYTIAITNVGTEAAYGVRITDVVPISTSFVAASGGGQNVGGIVSWTLDVPNVNVAYVRVLTVQLVAVLDHGLQITNTAWVSYGGALTESNRVVVTVTSTPTLHIVKTADPDPSVSAGRVLTYTITYSNSGNMVATGVIVTDTVDTNVAVISTVPNSDSLTGPVIVWTFGSLAPNTSEQITVVVRVTDTLADGSVIANVAEIDSAQGVYSSTGSVTTTVRSADIAVSKSVTPATARPGEWVTYTIVFTNVGGVDASNVTITDALPVSLTLVSSNTLGAVFAGRSGNSYGWISTTVPANSVGVITISAQVTTTGGWIAPVGTSLDNVVTSTTAADSAPGNDVGQATVTVIAGPAASIVIGISPSTGPIPGPATVAVTVTDQYGNLVADVDPYAVTLNGSSVDLNFSSLPINIVGGVGTASVDTTVAATYNVTALLTSNNAILATAPVTFTVGSVDRFVIGTVSTQTAGIGFTVDITAVDAYSNVVTGFGGSVQLADDVVTNTLQPPTTRPFVSGVLAGQDVTITLARPSTPILVGSGVSQTASNAFTVIPNVPSTITVSAAVNILLGANAPVTATVQDAYGNLVPGSVLTFGISLGTVTPPTGTTGPGGWATFDVSSIVTGGATIVVTASNQVTGSTAVTFVVGDPALIRVIIVPSYTSVNNTAAITVEVEDAWGNPVDWDTVTLTTTDFLGTGALAPLTSILLDASGRATGTISSSDLGPKTVMVTAASNGFVGSGVVTFTADAPQSVAVTMSPNPQTAGVNATLYATVTDQYGNPVPGVVITFGVASGALGGGGIVPNTGTTGASGVAVTSISSTLVTSALVTATVASDPTISDTVVAAFTAGSPALITVIAYPTSVGGGVNATLVATITDQFGNPVVGGPVGFTSGPLGSGGIVPISALSGSNGEVTVSISSTLPGPVVITATTVPIVVSDTTVLTITTGVLDHLEVSAVPGTLIAGVNYSVVITAVDATGFPRLDNGTISVVDATETVAPTSVMMANGMATLVFSVTHVVVSDQIALAWVASPAVTGTTNSFSVVAAAPITIVMTATPSSIRPNGGTSAIGATVEDAYGNRIAGRLVSFAAIAGPAVMLSPVFGVTDSSGQITITLISGTSLGVVTIEAAVGGVTGTVDVEISTTYVYLPIVMRSYTGVDLAPVSINVIDQGGGQYEVQVTLENNGPNALAADFWVDLYVDPAGPVGLNVLWNDVCTYGKAWFVRQDLAPGQQITLSTNDPDDPDNPSDRYSNWPGNFGSSGTHDLWVMVDSYGMASIGAVIETEEANNVSGPLLYTASVPAAGNASLEPIRPRPTPGH